MLLKDRATSEEHRLVALLALVLPLDGDQQLGVDVLVAKGRLIVQAIQRPRPLNLRLDVLDLLDLYLCAALQPAEEQVELLDVVLVLRDIEATDSDDLLEALLLEEVPLVFQLELTNALHERLHVCLTLHRPLLLLAATLRLRKHLQTAHLLTKLPVSVDHRVVLLLVQDTGRLDLTHTLQVLASHVDVHLRKQLQSAVHRPLLP